MSRKRTKKEILKINQERLKLYIKRQRSGLTQIEAKTYQKLLRIVSCYIKSISTSKQWEAYLKLSRRKMKMIFHQKFFS